MEATLYLDVYFLVNALMDLLLLDLVRLLFGLSGQRWRMLAAALLGAAWACGAVVLPLWSGAESGAMPAGLSAAFLILKMIFRLPVPAALMLLLAFGRVNLRALALRMAALFAAGVVLGGALEFAAERLPGKQQAAGAACRGISLPFLAVTSAAAAALLRLFVRAVEGYHRRQSLFRHVTLENGGRRVEVTALYDSGNRLFEPYGHEPVHVVDWRVGQALKTPSGHAVLIPYRSVGKEGGLLWGMRIERMTEEREDGGRTVYDRPWIAVSRVKVSPQGRYEMLLHGKTE